MMVSRMLVRDWPVRIETIRSFSRRKASANDWKTRATSRLPPEMSLSGLLGSSIVRRPLSLYTRCSLF